MSHHCTQHPADIFGVASAGHVGRSITAEIQTVIQDREANAQNVSFKLFKTKPYVTMKEMTSSVGYVRVWGLYTGEKLHGCSIL